MENELSLLKSNQIDVISFPVTQIPITLFKMKQSGVESEVQCHTCFHGII